MARHRSPGHPVTRGVSIIEEERFRRIFRTIHAHHAGCIADEWHAEACATADGTPVDRPIAWSRRNGPWRRVDILWVGAAPGNAGGKGKGILGAHGTRIPFGGDIAGANLEVLFSSIGITRNETFISAALNSLPQAGGGEPKPSELAAPVGDYPSSLHSLRDVIIATGPKLIVALGNVGLRACLAAGQLDGKPVRLPSQKKVEQAGLHRNEWGPWPSDLPPSAQTLARWREAWGGDALPSFLWLTHPSAQNMSPYAGTHTAFHRRMVDAVETLRAAVRDVLGWEPPLLRARYPAEGIYALREWRELVGPRHEMLDKLWREKGV
jgi:uracil-DNA glycosylase